MQITVTLTEQQFRALSALIDAGVRAGGMQAVGTVNIVLPALDAGLKAAQEDAAAPPSNVVKMDAAE